MTIIDHFYLFVFPGSSRPSPQTPGIGDLGGLPPPRSPGIGDPGVVVPPPMNVGAVWIPSPISGFRTRGGTYWQILDCSFGGRTKNGHEMALEFVPGADFR